AGLPVLRTRTEVLPGAEIRFADRETLLVATRVQLRRFHLAGDGSLSAAQTTAVSDLGQLRVSGDGARAAGATTTRHLQGQRTTTGDATSNELLCKGALNDLSFVPHRTLIAYVCQDGDAGTWDWQQHINTIVGHVDGGGSIVTASED